MYLIAECRFERNRQSSLDRDGDVCEGDNKSWVELLEYAREAEKGSRLDWLNIDVTLQSERVEMVEEFVEEFEREARTEFSLLSIWVNRQWTDNVVSNDDWDEFEWCDEDSLEGWFGAL